VRIERRFAFVDLAVFTPFGDDNGDDESVRVLTADRGTSGRWSAGNVWTTGIVELRLARDQACRPLLYTAPGHRPDRPVPGPSSGSPNVPARHAVLDIRAGKQMSVRALRVPWVSGYLLRGYFLDRTHVP